MYPGRCAIMLKYAFLCVTELCSALLHIVQLYKHLPPSWISYLHDTGDLYRMPSQRIMCEQEVRNHA